jgi:hypothetical protein
MRLGRLPLNLKRGRVVFCINLRNTCQIVVTREVSQHQESGLPKEPNLNLECIAPLPSCPNWWIVRASSFHLITAFAKVPLELEHSAQHIFRQERSGSIVVELVVSLVIVNLGRNIPV